MRKARAAYPRPPRRRFRVYAFDPLLATDPKLVNFNTAVIDIPWEEDWEQPLEPGPVGEYFEVVDYDPAAEAFYAPLDPNHPYLLAQDGLPPSEGRPQFHQQMVYAVAMRTVLNFERALGRKVLWSPWKFDSKNPLAPLPGGADPYYVGKLRLYPHAMRDENAFYSPNIKAILFGYFRANQNAGGRSLPGGWVFTCLSQDVIAHETTHAILDGLHDRFIEATSPDTLAFHEGFADMVAVFQHFTQKEPLIQALAAQDGDLDVSSFLTDVAGQFGDARTQGGGALRTALDVVAGHAPQMGGYLAARDPHDRGAYLLAAVFEAFLTLYERRTADLLAVAPRVGAQADKLHPTIVGRLAEEASDTADTLLQIVVRALDYVPPIDIRFGEFLRALVTADSDLFPEDQDRHRTMIAEAFRRRGIFPEGVSSMAPDSLNWEAPLPESNGDSCRLPDKLLAKLDLVPRFRRDEIWKQARANCRALHGWLASLLPGEAAVWSQRLGVFLGSAPGAPPSVYRDDTGVPLVEVHSVRMARRTGLNSEDLRQLVVEITQRRHAYLDPDDQAKADGLQPGNRPGNSDFDFRGGATLIVDLRDTAVRYIIRKRIDDEERLDGERRFRFAETNPELATTYLADGVGLANEPLALLHAG